MLKTLSGRMAAAASLVLLALTPVRAANEGDLWETTSQMVMEGMPMQMPAQTQKICATREWTRPPASPDRSCRTSNFSKVGPKATWTVECTGQMKMTGVGEMTFSGTDSYTGSVKYTGDGMNMTVKLSGRKAGGCDNPQ
jgi:uncharacterized protein DUF3617